MDAQADMLALISPESVVPPEHPLRRIKPLVDVVLNELSPLFDEMYAEWGRPSIPPERLLKAKLLQALYTIRSENLLVESLHYNLLFRWFLDLNMTDPIWDNSTFSKNQQRLLQHRTADLFFASVVELARSHGWVSDEHFTVDGTLIEAWASLKSFQPKDQAADPKDDDRGNPTVDFKGQKRSNQTHESQTDPAAKLMRKGAGKEAKLSFGMHALMENRHGLCVQVAVTASTEKETTAAKELIGRQIDETEKPPATWVQTKVIITRSSLAFAGRKTSSRTWRPSPAGKFPDWMAARPAAGVIKPASVCASESKRSLAGLRKSADCARPSTAAPNAWA